jgi:hypothetical protein
MLALPGDANEGLVDRPPVEARSSATVGVGVDVEIGVTSGSARRSS